MTENKTEKQEKQPSPLETQVVQLQQKLATLERERMEEKAKLELERQKLVEQQEILEKKKLEERSSLKRLMKEDDEASGNDDVTREQKIEMMSNNQLLSLVAESVDAALEARDQLVEKTFVEKQKGLVDEIEGLKRVVISQRAETEVEKATKIFPDFGEYREKTAQVLQHYPGMDVGHAYLLAKSLSSLTATSRQETETERPNREATRSLEGRETVAEEARRAREMDRREKPTAGLKGFRSILDKALDKVVVE